MEITLVMRIEENGRQVNKFFDLKLELDRINAISLNWTVVHAINEDSPFYGLSKEDLIAGRAEILFFVKAFDDLFSNTVVARSTYFGEKIVFGAKFLPMYYRNENSGLTILNMDKLNEIERKDISFTTMMKIQSGDAAISNHQ